MNKRPRGIATGCLIAILFVCACRKHATDPSVAYDWAFSTPEAQGLNPQRLSDAFNQAGQLGFVHSLLIVRNGFLVAERYFNGYDANDAHNVRSVSKSFISALVGIALREGFLHNLDQKILDFFPEYVTPGMDPRKYDITIQHLLTMTAGFDHEHNLFFQIYNSANWIQTTLQLPLLYDPGERFLYNTFETHLLSGILTKATGMSTLEFAQTHLFEPLGIAVNRWEQDSQGVYFGGTDMFFAPRDMARFGYLYLQDGLLDGEQIVPSDWVGDAVQYAAGGDWTWGEGTNLGYGYLWWIGTLGGYHVYFALGHGGQYIMNIPALHMIIVTTSYSNIDWDTADEQERSVLQFMADFILPAVQD